VIYRRTVGFKREFRNLPPEIKRAARAKFAPVLGELAASFAALSQAHRRFLAWSPGFRPLFTEEYRVLFMAAIALHVRGALLS
jgi:hypothetical protein